MSGKSNRREPRETADPPLANVADPKTTGCPAKLTSFQGERDYDGGHGKVARIVSTQREAEVHGKLPGRVSRKPGQRVHLPARITTSPLA
jgi:hypothetical protein